jgi:hypothetical protein
MRRTAKISQTVEKIDSLLSTYPTDGNSIIRDALCHYRQKLVDEFYSLRNKPTTKTKPIEQDLLT